MTSKILCLFKERDHSLSLYNKDKKKQEHYESFCKCRNKVQDSSIVLNIENQTCHDPKTIVNHFNSFITTMATKLVKKMSTAKGLFSEVSNAFVNFYKRKNPVDKKMLLEPVNEDFIYKNYQLEILLKAPV